MNSLSNFGGGCIMRHSCIFFFLNLDQLCKDVTFKERSRGKREGFIC